MSRLLAILLLLTTLAAKADDPFPRPQTPFAPRGYFAPKVTTPPAIDGLLDDTAWRDAPWSAEFVDIEGDLRPAPAWPTRMKMAWDDTHLYIAGHMAEPDLWATLVDRDAVIYHDDDFEVFLDPDGDNHLYYELEVNALNTVWDLLLIKPYRDGGPAVNAWDIAGLRTAVHCDGTLNTPSDTDTGWTVEIAIPWSVLRECAGSARVPPEDGDQWRVNFSRIDWDLRVVDGRYEKLDRPEHNWVWSPQGLIAMHYPERWGVVEFRESSVGIERETYEAERELHAAAALMHLYYEEQDYQRREGEYTRMTLELDLRLDEEKTGIDTTWFSWPPRLDSDDVGFHGWTRVFGRGVMHVDEMGRLWWTETQ